MVLKIEVKKIVFMHTTSTDLHEFLRVSFKFISRKAKREIQEINKVRPQKGNARLLTRTKTLIR